MPSPTSERGKLLALDLGMTRIGVAVCDPLGLAARPLEVIVRRSRREDFDRLAVLVEAEQVSAVVCGLPLNMDGSEGPQAATTRKWAERLGHALRTLLGAPIPIIFWDERLSSYVADEILAATGIKVGQDAAAAAVILQSYLDARREDRLIDYGRIELPQKP